MTSTLSTALHTNKECLYAFATGTVADGSHDSARGKLRQWNLSLNRSAAIWKHAISREVLINLKDTPDQAL